MTATNSERSHDPKRWPFPQGPVSSFFANLLADTGGTLAQRELLSRLAGIVWIIFLVAPVVDLFRRPDSSFHRALLLAGLAVFLAVFLALFLGRLAMDATVGRRHRLGIAVLYVLAIALTLAGGPTWLILFYFSEGALGWLRTPAAARGIVATILLVFALDRFLGGTNAQAGATAAQTALVGVLVLGMFQMIRTNAALNAAREEIARLAVAEERLRFARDLHDLLGHSLSLITLKSELAGQLAPVAPERAAREIQDIERVAREALREVREAVAGYRQPTLATELANIRVMLDAAGIAAAIRDTAGPLPAAVDAVLAWAVREGGTNVVRHSRARQCRITITREANTAVAAIADDGRGSDPESAGGANGTTGSGLAGLRERAAALNGDVTAGPMAGGGFRLRVAIPLTAEVRR